MGALKTSITPENLIGLIGSLACPVIFDVHRRQVFDQAGDLIPTATWRDQTRPAPPTAQLTGVGIVVYCVHGHQVGQTAAATFRSAGIHSRRLKGGIEAYRAAGGPLLKKGVLPGRVASDPSHRITRERPKIDRIACPWFIRRFTDRDALIHFVESQWVRDAAVELDAIPFGIPDVDLSRAGEICSFDAFLDRFDITERALRQLAVNIRGADTGHPALAPQAEGLRAISLGLLALYGDDLAMMEAGFALYDSLYTWGHFVAAKTHGWPPAKRIPCSPEPAQ